MDEKQNQEEFLKTCAHAMCEDLGNCWGLLLKELGELQRETKYTLTIYRQNADVLDLLNRSAPDFFGLVQTLLYDSMVLRIGRLIDRDRASVSLHRLATLACADSDRLELLISEIEIAAAQVKVWRNKVIAHNDHKVAADGGPEDLTWDKVEIVLSKTEECLRIVGVRYNSDFASLSSSTDATRLIEVLSSGLTGKDEYLQDENSRSYL